MKSKLRFTVVKRGQTNASSGGCKTSNARKYKWILINKGKPENISMNCNVLKGLELNCTSLHRSWQDVLLFIFAMQIPRINQGHWEIKEMLQRRPVKQLDVMCRFSAKGNPQQEMMTWTKCRRKTVRPQLRQFAVIFFEVHVKLIFRWFKFTLKPPYTVGHENLLWLIWDTSHWNSFLKFGLRTAYDMS